MIIIWKSSFKYCIYYIDSFLYKGAVIQRIIAYVKITRKL